MATLSLPKKADATAPVIKSHHAAGDTPEYLRHLRVIAATAWLQSTYKAFERCVPLAIGVRAQTMADKPSYISNKSLHMARARWCRSTRYLNALAAEGAVRYHLDGSVAGPVSPEHRIAAQEALAKS